MSSKSIVIGCALLHVILAVITVWSMAPTTDEPEHIRYGLKVLKGDPDRRSLYEYSPMPVSALNAAPRALAALFHSETTSLRSDRTIRPARLMSVAISVALLFLLAAYARRLYGDYASVFVAVAYVLSPNILAHATLATPDLATAFGFVASTYCFWLFLRDPSRRNLVLSALALGAAQLMKTSCLLLILAQCLVFVIYIAAGEGARYTRGKRARIYGEYLLATAVIACAVINAGFLFRGSFRPLASYSFGSPALRRVQALPVIPKLPMPLPRPFIVGVDQTRITQRDGTTFGGPYLLGILRNATNPSDGGFPSYYAVVYFLKEPIVLQIFLLLGCWKCWRRGWKSFCEKELPMVAASVCLVVYLSFFNRAQVGIRHILPALAFFLLIASGLFQDYGRWKRSSRLALIPAFVWLAASFFSYFPNMIPYTNELVWNRAQIWRYFADSNLSWGQGNWQVSSFLQANPDVILNPEHPVAGRVLIEANRLTGIYGGSMPCQWLRKLEPAGQVAYSHILFNVLPSQL